MELLSTTLELHLTLVEVVLPGLQVGGVELDTTRLEPVQALKRRLYRGDDLRHGQGCRRRLP